MRADILCRPCRWNSRHRESVFNRCDRGWLSELHDGRCEHHRYVARVHHPQSAMITTRGMTFIEVLVWISVFLAAMWAIVGSILSFYRANTYTLEQAQAVSEARRSIETVVGTLREATFSNEGAYPVVSIAAGSITFYADIDADPVA